MYNLIYNETWRSGPSAPAALGHSLHRALDAFLSKENNDTSRDHLLELYDQVWVNEGYASPQETMDAYERGRGMLEHFHEIDKNREGTVLATEKQFELEIAPGVFFKGTLDRLDQLSDGTYAVIEYKTQHGRWTEEKIAQDLQMTFYALGMSETLKTTSLKLRYYFLSSGQLVETTRTKQQLEEARTLLLDIGEKIRRREFPPDHSYCSKCEFGKRCKNFKS